MSGRPCCAHDGCHHQPSRYLYFLATPESTWGYCDEHAKLVLRTFRAVALEPARPKGRQARAAPASA